MLIENTAGNLIQLVLIAGAALLLVWLGALTYFYISSVRHYKKLKIETGQNLYDALETIIDDVSNLDSSQQAIKSDLGSVKTNILGHIQQVALKRFNPFEDTGSDQSFSLALLDKNGNGMVLSSLHGRNGTRIYAKPVKSGAQDTYELSTEEKEVISSALKGS